MLHRGLRPQNILHEKKNDVKSHFGSAVMVRMVAHETHEMICVEN